jgi:hypothetical protein
MNLKPIEFSVHGDVQCPEDQCTGKHVYNCFLFQAMSSI